MFRALAEALEGDELPAPIPEPRRPPERKPKVYSEPPDSTREAPRRARDIHGRYTTEGYVSPAIKLGLEDPLKVLLGTPTSSAVPDVPSPSQLIDPLALLLRKEDYVQSAKLGVVLAEKAREAGRAVKAAAQKVLPIVEPAELPPALKAFDPRAEGTGLGGSRVPPPSARAPREEALKIAARTGNNFRTDDVLDLTLGQHTQEAEKITMVFEAPPKREANFSYIAARAKDELRTRTTDDQYYVSSAALDRSAQPVPARTKERLDPILQATLPDRRIFREGWEDYNFCTDIPAATPAHKVPVRCAKEAFLAAGGSLQGLGLPADATAELYSLPTWAEMKIFLARLAAEIRSPHPNTQQAAQRALLGGAARPTERRWEPGMEVFARVGPSRTLVRRRIVSGFPLPTAAFPEFVGAQADYLAIGALYVDSPQKWRWSVRATAGLLLTVNKEMWDFEVESRDEPGDFRALRAGRHTSREATALTPYKPHYLRINWSAYPEDIVEYQEAVPGSKPKLLGSGAVKLTQSVKAPMMRFAVYARERSSPPRGTYANPQFVGTFGSGRRFEERRCPDLFYSLTHDVEIDNRRNTLAGYDSYAVFKTQSFWQCTTPVSPMAWRTLTWVMRFEVLPTAGASPMRCVAGAYPFFLYLAYTPARAGADPLAQGVYLYLYRQKGAAYVFSRQRIERASWYYISVSYTDGIPGNLALRVVAMKDAVANVRTLYSATAQAIMRVEDDVFYRMQPAEATGAVGSDIPYLSLGWQKYGGGSAGMTAIVARMHVFDYTLSEDDYKVDIADAWEKEWWN